MMYGINLTRHGIILGMQEMKVNFQMYQKCMQVKTRTKLTLEKAEKQLLSWCGNMKWDFGQILESFPEKSTDISTVKHSKHS